MENRHVLIPGLSPQGLVYWMSVMVMVIACQKAMAVPETLWQIGKFDHSSAEFKQDTAGQPRRWPLPETPVVYIVGKSNPKTDWRAYQPGSANAKAGHRPHPYSIQFHLPERPAAVIS